MTALLTLTPHAVAKHAKTVQSIPFKLYRNHLVVATGSLGHLQQRNLLIDTGTNPSVVDEGLAYQLGLKSTGRPPEGMSIVGGVAQTYYAVLESFDFGPIHRQSMPIAVANLSLMQAEVGLRIDAIIGLDAIFPTSFQIDYDSRKISFGAIRLPSSALPMLQAKPFVVVPSQINRTTVNLVIDTGTSELVLFPNALAPGIASLPARGTRQLSNVAGDLVARQIYLSEFRVGNTDLSGRTAVLATVPHCCQFGGMLGISQIYFKRVTFDFEHLRLGLELPVRKEFTFSQSCQSFVGDASCQDALLHGLTPR